MSRHLRIKSPGSQLGVLLGVFCMMFILAGIVTFIIYAIGGIKTADFNNTHFVNVAKAVQAISSVLLFIVPPFFFARFTFTGNYAYFLGFKNAEKANMYILAILGM